MAVGVSKSAAHDRGDELPPAPIVKRWWFLPVVGVAILAAMMVLSIAVFALRMWQGHQQASRAVAAEVARIQAAGEPITTEDFYAFHRVPAGTRDITQEWLDALAAYDNNAIVMGLPIVGDQQDISLLRPTAKNSQFAEAGNYLQVHCSALQKIHAVAQLEGQCRFPFKFEEGINARLPHAQKMRSVVRLLELRARIRTLSGDVDGAISSIADMQAAGQTLAHQPTIIEQLVRIACATIAIQETEFLLSEKQLTAEQLAQIQKQWQALDLNSGLTMGMLGERGMNFHTFHHLSSVSKEIEGISLGATDGQLARPADCLKSLELLGDAVDASRQPFPAARQDVQQVENRIKGIVGSGNPLDRLKYLVTAMMVPATGAAFDATARTIARRDALLAAIAAERYRLDTGSFPNQLADHVPKYLPAVPVDPFDGKPLRMLTGDGQIVVYSVGKDEQDDQGVENLQQGQPDIAIRVRASKGEASSQP